MISIQKDAASARIAKNIAAIVDELAGNRTFVFTGLAEYQPQCGVMKIKQL